MSICSGSDDTDGTTTTTSSTTLLYTTTPVRVRVRVTPIPNPNPPHRIGCLIILLFGSNLSFGRAGFTKSCRIPIFHLKK